MTEKEPGETMTTEEARSILRVRENATNRDIRRAYHKRLIEAHPDHGGSMSAVNKIGRARDLLHE